jgi:hypothetical protein
MRLKWEAMASSPPTLAPSGAHRYSKKGPVWPDSRAMLEAVHSLLKYWHSSKRLVTSAKASEATAFLPLLSK